MAIKNRTEAIAEVNAKLVPTITAAIHRDNLNNDILNSVKFDKDVIGTETPVAGAVTVDFSTKDLATLTTIVNLSVTITGLENGAEKYIKITKNGGNVISFVSTTDATTHKIYINRQTGTFIYKITKKDNVTYAQILNLPPYDNRSDSYRLTAAGYTMTADFEFKQVTTQIGPNTITLPVTSTLALGHSYQISNKGGGKLTINSSGSNCVGYVEIGQTIEVMCILTSGTTAASWQLLPGFPNTVSDTIYFNEPLSFKLNMTAGILYTALVATPVSPYVAASGVFTAPAAGVYSFNAILAFTYVEIAATNLYMAFVHSTAGSFEKDIDPRIFAASPARYSMSLSWTVKMAAAETMSLKYRITGGASTTDLSATFSTFSGCRVI